METILLTIAIFNIFNSSIKKVFTLTINHNFYKFIQIAVYVWSYLYIIYKLIEFLKNYKVL